MPKFFFYALSVLVVSGIGLAGVLLAQSHQASAQTQIAPANVATQLDCPCKAAGLDCNCTANGQPCACGQNGKTCGCGSGQCHNTTTQ